jgi:hypothetical protein
VAEAKKGSKGGKAAAEKMTPEERTQRAKKAVEAREAKKALPVATHGSADHPLKILDVEIPCYVLSDGTRVITQDGFLKAIGRSGRPKGGTGASTALDNAPSFLFAANLKPLITNEFLRSTMPMEFMVQNAKAFGYRAELLPQVCNLYLRARDQKLLHYTQAHVAERADMLVRGLAETGIVALVDEATGYQKDRARDALAKILEAFVAKELQPWVKTFDSDYYEQIFRLRGLPYPPETSNLRPQYFGKLTNDIVYRRLAPGVLDALKDEAKKSEKKSKLFQHLTAGYGRQELLKHLGSVVTLMKISDAWSDFLQKLNRVAPRYGETVPLDLEEADR